MAILVFLVAPCFVVLAGVANADVVPPSQDCPGGLAGLICHGRDLVGTGVGAISNPVGAVGGVAGGLAVGALGEMARNFGQAAVGLLHELAGVFISTSTVDLSRSGIDGLVAITLPIASLLAALLVIVSAASTAWKQDGSPLATSLLGLARAALIAGALLAVWACPVLTDRVVGLVRLLRAGPFVPP